MAHSKPIVEAMKPREDLGQIHARRRHPLRLVAMVGARPLHRRSPIDIDSNAVERAMRPIALGPKTHLITGSDGGAEHWAVPDSLIETSKK